MLSPALTDSERVEDVLDQASKGLGSVYGAAVRPLFGITEASRGKLPVVRHHLAHAAFCAAEYERLQSGQEPHSPTFETFRTRTEKEILRDLALEIDEKLCEKLNEHEGK